MDQDPESRKTTGKPCENVREEFRVQKFGFSDVQPRYFVTAQCFSPTLFCVWTGFWALFHMTVICLQFYFIDDHPNPKWLSFLTNWGYTLLALSAVWDCVCTLYVNTTRKDLLADDASSNLSWYLKIQWILCNVSTVTAVVITLLFYSLLTPDFTASSTLKHAINSVYAVLSLTVSAKPVRLLHVYQAVLFSVVYSVFSLVYQKAGGGAIYTVLDWDKMPNTVLLSLATVLVVVPMVHLVMFTIYRLRVFAWNSCCRKRQVCDDADVGRNANFDGSRSENTKTDERHHDSAMSS
uniref:Protein rolling stone n=1 Tax=Magallana gigas TaxID=29159 RepID=A0A8W8M472_MAGGI|nr:protein rolling stone-like [Crassostrea gigas]